MDMDMGQQAAGGSQGRPERKGSFLWPLVCGWDQFHSWEEILKCPYKEHWHHPQYLVVSEVSTMRQSQTSHSRGLWTDKWSASPQFPNQQGINQQWQVEREEHGEGSSSICPGGIHVSQRVEREQNLTFTFLLHQMVIPEKAQQHVNSSKEN